MYIRLFLRIKLLFAFAAIPNWEVGPVMEKPSKVTPSAATVTTDPPVPEMMLSLDGLPSQAIPACSPYKMRGLFTVTFSA